MRDMDILITLIVTVAYKYKSNGNETINTYACGIKQMVLQSSCDTIIFFLQKMTLLRRMVVYQESRVDCHFVLSIFTVQVVCARFCFCSHTISYCITGLRGTIIHMVFFYTYFYVHIQFILYFISKSDGKLIQQT